MAAYIVFTKERVLNQAELDIYQQKVRATFEGHPVKVLAAYGQQEALEGSAPLGVVIVEFPTMDAAKGWYDSAAYKDARQHRFDGADYRATLVQGI